MTIKKLLTLSVGPFITVTLFAVFGALLVPEASAQYRRGVTWRTERVESRNVTRIAEAQGRNDGLREGGNAARTRKRYNPYGESKYRKGTNGYKSRFGNKATYKRIYQQAFVRGYNEAYYRSPRGVRRVRRDW
jgi:hypothetical protein